MCYVLLRKKNIRKEAIFTMSLSETTERRKTPTARTESHKNLLTSLKILQLSFYFLFIIFYGDPWWLEKQHSLYILSRFLNFLVENILRLRHLSAGDTNLCVNMLRRQKTEKKSSKKDENFSARLKNRKFLFSKGFKEKLLLLCNIFFLEIWVLSPWGSEKIHRKSQVLTRTKDRNSRMNSKM